MLYNNVQIRETQANIEIQRDKNVAVDLKITSSGRILCICASFQSYFQTQSAKFTLACKHQTVF